MAAEFQWSNLSQQDTQPFSTPQGHIYYKSTTDRPFHGGASLFISSGKWDNFSNPLRLFDVKLSVEQYFQIQFSLLPANKFSQLSLILQDSESSSIILEPTAQNQVALDTSGWSVHNFILPDSWKGKIISKIGARCCFIKNSQNGTKLTQCFTT